MLFVKLLEDGMKMIMIVVVFILMVFVVLLVFLNVFVQVNGVIIKESVDLLFRLIKIVQFDYFWKIVFLFDGWMLVMEKFGKFWIVMQKGQKLQVSGVLKVEYEGQGGFLGVYLLLIFDKDCGVYFIYVEFGDGGLSFVLVCVMLSEGDMLVLKDFKVIWCDMLKG